jgi:hypothetical protein
MDGCICKPVNTSELAAVPDRAMARREAAGD